MDEAEVRKIVDERIASLCGLVLRRTQDVELTRNPAHNTADQVARGVLAEIFGEALNDFTDEEVPVP